MGLTYRDIKGSPLSFDEMDSNIRHFTGSHSITGSLTLTSGSITISGSGTVLTSNQTGSLGSLTITGSLTVSGSQTLTNYGDLKNFNGDQIYYLDSGSREHKVLNYAVPSDSTVIFLAAYSASISKIQMVNLPTTEAQASSFGTGSLWMSGSNGNSSYLMIFNP